MKKTLAAGALAVALAQTPAFGGELDGLLSGVDFTVSGFGTFGTVRTDTNIAAFTRDQSAAGATETPSEKVDSALGVQFSATVTPWLSATVQALSKERSYTRYLSTDLAWAYVKVTPLDQLAIKIGRIEPPLFAISDSRDIGYANTWVRPPDEVYALGNIEELNGASVSWTQPVGPYQLSATGYFGNTHVYAGYDFSAPGYDVHGGELRVESEWITLRGGFAEADINIESVNNGVLAYSKYRFAGVGALVDHHNIVAQAEYVRRSSPESPTSVDSNGFYILGGYRFGSVLPYAYFAKTVKSKPFNLYGIASGDQDTKALGVRWDAFKSAALKFQYQRVNPRDTIGISFAPPNDAIAGHQVNVLSLALDFVF